MDVHEFEKTMSLVIYLAGNNQFHALGQGLLVELAEQGNHDPKGPHRLKKVYFGYRENNQPIPKIAVEFQDGNILAVKWL